MDNVHKSFEEEHQDETHEKYVKTTIQIPIDSEKLLNQDKLENNKEPEYNTENIELLAITDILARHEQWKTSREEAKRELDNLNAKNELIKFENEIMESNPDLVRELAQMNELDSLFEEKNHMAKQLKQSRLTRESSFVHHSHLKYEAQPTYREQQQTEDGVRNNSIDEQQFRPQVSSKDLKSTSMSKNASYSSSFASDASSVYSTQADLESLASASINRKTFITEPKLMQKNKSGRPLMPQRQSGKSYKKGDFVQRNILLGGEARYYDALTEFEKDRIEEILGTKKKNKNEGQENEGNDDDNDSNEEQVNESSNENGVQQGVEEDMISTPFSTELTKNEKFIEINKKLSSVSLNASLNELDQLLAVPASVVIPSREPKKFHILWKKLSFPSKKKDLNTVLCDVDTLKDISEVFNQEYKKLKEIDDRLQEISQQSVTEIDPSALISEERIKALIQECKQEEIELTSILSRCHTVEEFNTQEEDEQEIERLE